MGKSNQIKAEALGMSYGAAANRLRKMILFDLVCRLRLNVCFQCGTEILSINDLSIEHKKPWLRSDDPIHTYFDLNNIAFSHLSCNCAAAADTNTKYYTEKDRAKARQKYKKTWVSKQLPGYRKDLEKKYYDNVPVKERQRRRKERYLRTGR